MHSNIRQFQCVVSVGILFLVLLPVLCCAQRLPAGSDRTQQQQPARNSNSRDQKDGRNGEFGWIVMLVDSPTVGYTGGGAAAMAATAANAEDPSARFNPSSVEAQAYAQYLETQSISTAARVGAADKVTYTYKHAAAGFHVSSLSAKQLAALKQDPAVASVHPNTIVRGQSLSTPRWLGLVGPGRGSTPSGYGDATGAGGVWEKAFGSPNRAGEDIVIGVLDSGIWPEHPSFSDRKMTPGSQEYNYTPVNTTLYRGKCTAGEQLDPATDCNRKLIGCQAFGSGWASRKAGARGVGPIVDIQSCRDPDGHGTHTASTAAGNFGTPFVGNHTLSGMAPKARIAAYKVLWNYKEDTGAPLSNAGTAADLVAGIDKAIADGVSIINYSIGGIGDVFPNPIDLAFMRAARAGIFVAVSAGNDGASGEGSLDDTAPWTTTVAAATHNRLISSSSTVIVALGQNGTSGRFPGASFFHPGHPPTGLVLAEDVAVQGVALADARLCLAGTLDRSKVQGRIVACDKGGNARTDKSVEVYRAGGIGMLLLETDTFYSNNDQHIIPTVHLKNDYSEKVKAYARSVGAVCSVQGFESFMTWNATAPLIAGLSSVGPDFRTKGAILKPDVAAPGVNIIAAVSPLSNIKNHTFAMWSGTSMATPHIAGLAALVKQANPSWSPMAIKSALMTTAYITTKSGKAGKVGENPLYTGAGHVDATQMLNPGLVFDSSYEDWARLLCSLAYPGVTLPSDVASHCMICSTNRQICNPANFNTPSIALPMAIPGQVVTVVRTVKSVMSTQATYTTSSVASSGRRMSIVSITPKEFTLSPGQTQRLEIKIRLGASVTEGMGYNFGWVRWAGRPTGNAQVMAARGSIPVAVKAMPSVMAPQEVGFEANATTSSRNYTYQATPGYSGILQLYHTGMYPAQVIQGSVQRASSSEMTVTMPEGVQLVRFGLYTSDLTPAGFHDLDLYVLLNEVAIASSILDRSDEAVMLWNPEPGEYTVRIEPYIILDEDVTFFLHIWALGNATMGNVRMPSTIPVVAGKPTNVTFQFREAPITVAPIVATVPSSVRSVPQLPQRYVGGVIYARAGKAIGATVVHISDQRDG